MAYLEAVTPTHEEIAMKTYSPVEVLTGHAKGITEPRRIGCEHGGATKGHRADQGGLRGHSVGEAYPWRIVGYGDHSWAVEGPNGHTYGRYYGKGACSIAHERARELKARYPDGRVDA